MKQVCIDIEVYRNKFILGCAEFISEVRFSYEITDKVDQRLDLYLFLKETELFWINFNGVRYDNVILAYGQKNRWWPELTPLQVCNKLKEFSDRLINADDDVFYNVARSYQNYFKFTNIDLYLYWSKLLRLSRKISLKGLGIQLGYPVVQELPYSPDLILTDEQWEEVKVYNLEHDLGILLMLAKAMQDDILLRDTIHKSSKLNTWSMDAPKIASELLLQDYCNKLDLDESNVRGWRFDKPTIYFNKLFKDFNPGFTNPIIQDAYQTLLNSIDNFSKEIILFNHDESGIKISISNGGIHSVNNNEEYFANQEYILIDSDIESLYPRLIEVLGVFRFKEVNQRYSEIKTLRITESKPNFKKAKLSNDKEAIRYWKLQDEFYKLVLNSTSGLIDMEHSWLYNPEKILQLRLTGQMILLRCIQDCIDNGWKVFSTNTDGLTVKIPRGDLQKYTDLIDQIGQEFSVKFEHETFKSIHYQNVNSYVAITDTGLVKKKGQFVTKPVLSTSVDNLIIPKLLQCYFESGIKPATILSNMDTFKYTWDKEVGEKPLHIYDFCASQKVDRSYKVVWNGEVQQRLNRYYVSKKGAYLYKSRDGKLQHMLKGFGVQIYNNHTEQKLSSYSVNTGYYLKEVNKIINGIENNNQLQMF